MGTLSKTRNTVFAAPLTVQKGYVPDILSWSVGTEVAIGRRNTLVLDVSGNQIGLAHGAQLLDPRSITAPAPKPLNGAIPQANGLTGVDTAGKALKGSFAQYSGSFGYKVKIAGNLVATFQAVVRMNSTGLTARFVPLYGLGYSF